MIWKLFVSVLAVSDVGSVSTSALVTDYPTRTLCEQAAVDYGQGHDMTLNNHKIIIRLSASCSPGSEAIVMQDGTGVPPPVMGMLRGFLDGMERR